MQQAASQSNSSIPEDQVSRQAELVEVAAVAVFEDVEFAGDAPPDVVVEPHARAQGEGQLVAAGNRSRAEVGQVAAFEVEGAGAAVAGVMAPVRLDERV